MTNKQKQILLDVNSIDPQSSGMRVFLIDLVQMAADILYHLEKDKRDWRKYLREEK